MELFELFQNNDIEMDMALSPPQTSAGGGEETPVLQVVIYGNRSLCHGIKLVLHGQGLYLQDPVGAVRDARYWNPQRYFNSPKARTSDFWNNSSKVEAKDEPVNYGDNVSAFTTGDDLRPTDPVSCVRTPLKLYADHLGFHGFFSNTLVRHQKQALTFMLSREQGWNLGNPHADIWSLKSGGCGTVQ